MLFGDDALYYQIVHDAHDPDPAVAWRHRPFMSLPAPFTAREPRSFDAEGQITRLGAGFRVLTRRWQPQPGANNACCLPACC